MLFGEFFAACLSSFSSTLSFYSAILFHISWGLKCPRALDNARWSFSLAALSNLWDIVPQITELPLRCGNALEMVVVPRPISTCRPLAIHFTQMSEDALLVSSTVRALVGLIMVLQLFFLHELPPESPTGMLSYNQDLDLNLEVRRYKDSSTVLR